VEGHARGAVLAQSQLIASAQQIGRVWSLGLADRWLGVLPLFHAAGIGLSLAMLAAGGACVLLPRFDPDAAIAAIDEHQITVCATFAPMLGAMLDAAQTHGSSLPSLRICTGLEPPATLERLATLCPSAGFWSAYGQAEVSSMVCMGLQHERPGTAGRAAHKQLIKTGGENVYPAEVEQVLLEHPAVAEAFVYGQADDHWGEAVHAACALRPGKVASEAELIAFVEKRLARYKRPQSVRFMAAPLDRAIPFR